MIRAGMLAIFFFCSVVDMIWSSDDGCFAIVAYRCARSSCPCPAGNNTALSLTKYLNYLNDKKTTLPPPLKRTTCTPIYLETKGGKKQVGCDQFCRGDSGYTSKLVAGEECLAVFLNATEVMKPNTHHICTLGLCMDDGTCLASGLAIECVKPRCGS